MKVLFWGGIEGEGGPNSVNRGIVQNLTPCFRSVKSENKYIQMLEVLLKCFNSDVIVISGVSKQGMLLTAFSKLLGRKTVYLMHGCAEYEVAVNQQENCEQALKQERFLLKYADLLLPVSKKFRNWVCDRYPQYAHKAKYLYNGIDKASLADRGEVQKKKGTVAAAGADRGVKNNIVISRAVEEMNGNAELTVFGTIYDKAPKEFRYSRYFDRIPRSDFLEKLCETELFVVNSIFESFNISVIEALCCGCSILISEIVGVTDLLELEESDIIHDPMDVQEIRSKIEYLLEHPNNARIMSKLDLDEYSYQKSVERLEELCRELIAM